MLKQLQCFIYNAVPTFMVTTVCKTVGTVSTYDAAKPQKWKLHITCTATDMHLQCDINVTVRRHKYILLWGLLVSISNRLKYQIQQKVKIFHNNNNNDWKLTYWPAVWQREATWNLMQWIKYNVVLVLSFL